MKTLPYTLKAKNSDLYVIYDGLFLSFDPFTYNPILRISCCEFGYNIRPERWSLRKYTTGRSLNHTCLECGSIAGFIAPLECSFDDSSVIEEWLSFLPHENPLTAVLRVYDVLESLNMIHSIFLKHMAANNLSRFQVIPPSAIRNIIATIPPAGSLKPALLP